MEKTETVHVRLRPAQKELLDAAVELAGFNSRSEAFRAVLVTWAREVFRARVRDAMEGDSDGEQLEALEADEAESEAVTA